MFDIEHKAMLSLNWTSTDCQKDLSIGLIQKCSGKPFSPSTIEDTTFKITLDDF